jgi:hypothetical protein
VLVPILKLGLHEGECGKKNSSSTMPTTWTMANLRRFMISKRQTNSKLFVAT